MINPILERELKTRMRTWRTPILITVYLLLIGMVVAFFFLVSGLNNYGYGRSGFDPQVISTVFDVISIFQLVLLVMILPVFTATSISGERERQTLDLLLCTDISLWKIIFGKIVSALSFILLIVFAAMPFIGIVFLFGGISLFDIVKIVLFYMATAFMVSTIGMFTTIHFKKNIASIVMSYFILLCILILPLVFMGVSTVVLQSVFRSTPFMTFVESYSYEIISFLFASNPFFGMSSLLSTDIFNLQYMLNSSTTFWSNVQPWMSCLIFYTIFSTILLLLSRRKLGKLK